MADSVQVVAAEVAQALVQHTPDGPFALFGHSTDAVIAFELACAPVEATAHRHRSWCPDTRHRVSSVRITRCT